MMIFEGKRMTKSIIQKEKETCFFCGASTTIRHHIIHGNGFRQLSEDDGLWVYLCNPHHWYLHNLPSHPHDAELKALAQKSYIEMKVKEGYTNGQARGIWFSRYARYFD